MKTPPNNVYDVHCQQKLATPHTQDRCKQAEKRANRTKQRVPKKAHIVLLPTLGITLNLRKNIKYI